MNKPAIPGLEPLEKIAETLLVIADHSPEEVAANKPLLVQSFLQSFFLGMMSYIDDKEKLLGYSQRLRDLDPQLPADLKSHVSDEQMQDVLVFAIQESFGNYFADLKKDLDPTVLDQFKKLPEELLKNI